MCVCVCVWCYFNDPWRKFGLLYLGKAQQSQEQSDPFLSVCAVFLFVQTMVWLPVFGIVNVHTDDARHCTVAERTVTERK